MHCDMKIYDNFGKKNAPAKVIASASKSFNFLVSITSSPNPYMYPFHPEWHNSGLVLLKSTLSGQPAR